MDIYIISALLVLLILFFIVLIMCVKNGKRIDELNNYAEDGDLAEAMKKYYKKINELRVMIHDSSDKALESRISKCEERLNRSFSKMGIVNFDAFDEITGKLSFSMALLDDTDSGIILTSIYGHSSCNTYIRSIKNGVTATKLIDEENTALQKAVNGEKKVKSDE